MSDHYQVKTWNALRGKYVNIDSKIKELLELIWSYGIETTNSCQSNKNKICIEFKGEKDAKNFTDRLLRAIYDGELYKETNYFNERVLGVHSGRNNWRWSVRPQEDGYIDDDTFITELPVSILFHLSVGFPKRDYKQVVKLLREEVIN